MSCLLARLLARLLRIFEVCSLNDYRACSTLEKGTTGDMQDSDNENDLYFKRHFFHASGASGAEA